MIKVKFRLAVLFVLVLTGSVLALGGGGSWPYNGVESIPPGHVFGGIGVADATGVVYFRTEGNQSTDIAVVKARKLGPTGAVLWETSIAGSGVTGGPSVFFTDYNTRPAVLTSDGKMVVVYSDKRKDPNNNDLKSGTTEIYATKIEPLNGSVIWSTLVSSPDAVNTDASVAADNNGGVYISYEDQSGNKDIFIQHLDVNGALGISYQNGLRVSNSANYHDSNCTVEDGLGNAWVVWLEGAPHDGQFFIYARKVHVDGTIYMTSTSEVSALDTKKNFGLYTWNAFSPDGTGGIIIAWNQNNSIYAQSLNASGTARWNRTES